VPIADAGDRPSRIARRLRDAARAYEVPAWRVALRAARLRRSGWRLGEAAVMGMLDPGAELASFGWATRGAELERLQEALNPAGAADLAEDKRRFGELCERHDLVAARQMAVLERLGGAEETAAAWAAALDGAAPDGLVVKPVDGHRGLGVRVLERAPGGVQDHRGRAVGWSELARDLAAGPWPGYVVQERLRPHPDLVRLSGHGLLHTMRMITLRDDGGEPRIIGVVLRVAAGREPVDSFRGGRTGNLLAYPDGDGAVVRAWSADPSGFGLRRAPVHPATGARLEGFSVPGWEAAGALALRAAEAFVPLRAVGFDIAPTPAGPALVEANAWWSWIADPGGGPDRAAAALRDAAARQAARP
jgi:hypothetical protein